MVVLASAIAMMVLEQPMVGQLFACRDVWRGGEGRRHDQCGEAGSSLEKNVRCGKGRSGVGWCGQGRKTSPSGYPSWLTS